MMNKKIKSEDFVITWLKSIFYKELKVLKWGSHLATAFIMGLGGFTWGAITLYNSFGYVGVWLGTLTCIIVAFMIISGLR